MKNPGISLSATANHKTVTAGLFLHGNDISGIQNITVSNHGNLYRIFYFCNNVPVCLSGIKLLSGSSMHSHSRRTGCLRNLCNLHRIYMGIIKSFSNLYRYRLFNGAHCFFHDFSHQFGIFHQRGTFTVIYHLWHGTAHIDIQNIKVSFFDSLGLLRNTIRIGTKQLQGHRTFRLIYFQQRFGISVIVLQRLCRNHLHTNQACSLFFAKHTKRQVCYTCHWSQNQIIFKGNIPYLQGSDTHIHLFISLLFKD